MPLWGSSNTKSAEPDTTAADPPSYQDRDLERRQSQNDAAASASQAAGTAWLAGHLHHLTGEQDDKLAVFKKLCAERGYYTAAEGETKASHDDATMLYVYVLLGCWEEC